MRYDAVRQTEMATQSSPTQGQRIPPCRDPRDVPGYSYLNGIVKEYQNQCAARAVRCMKGHNRQGAKAWAAKCARLGEWRRA